MKTMGFAFMFSLKGMSQDVHSSFSTEEGKDRMQWLKSLPRDLVELKSIIKTFSFSKIDKIKNR